MAGNKAGLHILSNRPGQRGRAGLAMLLAGCGALLSACPCTAQSSAESTPPAIAVQPSSPQAAPATLGLSRWINPSTAPFIPVPVVAVDPNSGTTLGVLPTWIHTDEHHDIRRIVAPDILHNPYFGFGMHARVFAYPSENEQWSMVAGIQQKVQRGFDAEYQTERLREKRWSISSSLVYDRNGSPRFFGIGNRTTEAAQTNYTNQTERAQVLVGLNLTHIWQLVYTGRIRNVDVLPGTLNGIPSIETRFGQIPGLGTNHEWLNRLSVAYDSRDNLTVPHHGTSWVIYGGLAGGGGTLNDSMHSETGADVRTFFPVLPETILAGHLSLHYLPTTRRLPFWALSSIGGGENEIGGEQALRGFGAGRFYGRDAFAGSVEFRRKVASFDAISTRVDLELTPFVDVGRVFNRTSTLPFSQLHTVGGIGFRGIARPFVVGYVDIGYGSEGVAAFTGINYPF